MAHRDGLTLHRVEYCRSASHDPLQRDYEEGLSFVAGVLQHPAFRSQAYACIHTHHWTSGVGLPEALSTSDVRLVHTPHLLAVEKAKCLSIVCPSMIAAAETSLINRSDVVIAVSSSEADAIRRLIQAPRPRVEIVPGGVSEPFYSDGIAAPGSRYLALVTVGRICRQKGFDVLLDALELLLADGHQPKLLIVGSSYGEESFERAIRDRIQRAPLNGSVDLVDSVNNLRLIQHFRRAAMYVQPSRYESLGIALLEAMACGCAVIATDLCAIREYVRDRSNGRLVPAESPGALASAIVALHRSPERRIAYGRAARDTATAFRWKRAVDDTVQHLLGPG